MSIWSSLCTWFNDITQGSSGACDVGANSFHDSSCDINPANGLPMVGGCGGVDVEGNPYGTDWSHHDDWGTSGNSWDDSFSGSSSNWDTGIGSSWDD